jgi:hypothetical protein
MRDDESEITQINGAISKKLRAQQFYESHCNANPRNVGYLVAQGSALCTSLNKLKRDSLFHRCLKNIWTVRTIVWEWITGGR